MRAEKFESRLKRYVLAGDSGPTRVLDGKVVPDDKISPMRTRGT
jgi:hypothetical protein